MKLDIPFSILDLAPILKDSTAAQAFRNTLDLARHAEKWGYKRYWLAEHHSMPGIASAATAVVIGYVAGGTSTIRVGAGGVMLPNHAPLVIAEQFGTLESLYPGRIDLGLGRAPGTDQQTARALRRELGNSDDQFPRDVLELQHYFQTAVPGQVVRAVPGAGLNVPIWLLGSSLFSAQLAGLLGLPYAFASHFAPDDLMTALALYRSKFRPSKILMRWPASASSPPKLTARRNSCSLPFNNNSSTYGVVNPARSIRPSNQPMASGPIRKGMASHTRYASQSSARRKKCRQESPHLLIKLAWMNSW